MLADKDIKVYTIPTCPWCKQTKEYLDQKGVQYTNLDVAADQASFQEMVKLSGQMGVPVIVIDGEIQVGFNQGKVEESLSK